jgi:hypothetical protein
MNIPLTLIGKICGVNPVTIAKYIEHIKDQVKKLTTNQLEVHLFKLYTSTLVESKDFSMTLGYTKKTERVLYAHLKLDTWKLYIESMVNTINMYSGLSFDTTIPVSYHAVLSRLIKEDRAVIPPKEVFRRIILKMHEAGKYPRAGAIKNPSKTLQPLLENLFIEERKKIGYFVSITVYEKVRTCILQDLSDSNKGALALVFDLPEDDVSMDCKNLFAEYKTNLVRDRICRETVRKLRRRIHLDELPQTWSKVIDSHIAQRTTLLSAKEEIFQLTKELQSEREFREHTGNYPVVSVAQFIYNHLVDTVSLPNDIHQILIEHIPAYQKKIEESGIPGKFTPQLLETLTQDIRNIDFTVRTINCLRAADIFYVWQIFAYHKPDFLKFRNFGKKSLIELDEFAQEKKMYFDFKYDAATLNYLLSETNNGKRL